jgi:hypothetical protein
MFSDRSAWGALIRSGFKSAGFVTRFAHLTRFVEAVRTGAHGYL